MNVPKQTTSKLTPSFDPSWKAVVKAVVKVWSTLFATWAIARLLLVYLSYFHAVCKTNYHGPPKMTTLSCFCAEELFPLYFVLYVWLYPWPEAGESSLGLKAFRFLFSTRPHLSLKGHSMVICQSALLCKNTVKLALDSSSNPVITCMYYYKHRRCLEDLWPTIDLST